MTLFEFIFGLTAVILGLALTQMAMNLTRLAVAGRRVRWAPEPVMLMAIIAIVIVVLWFGGWREHNIQETTVGHMMLTIVRILLPAMAAAAVLPESIAPEGPIDLLAHYDGTRRFTYGVLIPGMLMGPVRELGGVALTSGSVAAAIPLALTLAVVGVYAVLMWVRTRWVNIAGLLFVLVTGASNMLAIEVVG